MKTKTLILSAFIAASVIGGVNAVNATSTPQTTQTAGVEEQSTAVLVEMYDQNHGKIRDIYTGEEMEFAHNGAQVDFIPGKEYTYVRIITPQGRVIVKQINKPS